MLQVRIQSLSNWNREISLWIWIELEIRKQAPFGTVVQSSKHSWSSDATQCVQGTSSESNHLPCLCPHPCPVSTRGWKNVFLRRVPKAKVTLQEIQTSSAKHQKTKRIYRGSGSIEKNKLDSKILCIENHVQKKKAVGIFSWEVRPQRVGANETSWWLAGKGPAGKQVLLVQIGNHHKHKHRHHHSKHQWHLQ